MNLNFILIIFLLLNLTYGFNFKLNSFLNINKTISCEECKTSMAQFDDLAIKHETEIINYLQNFCTELPIEQQPYCNDIVKLSLPNIIENFSPEIFCKQIDLCKTKFSWVFLF